LLPIFGKNVLRPGGESITNQQLCIYADSLSLIWTDFPTGEVEPILKEDRDNPPIAPCKGRGGWACIRKGGEGAAFIEIVDLAV